MYVEVLDHARHDGGGLGRAIGFSRQDSVSRSPHGTRVFGTFLPALPLKMGGSWSGFGEFNGFPLAVDTQLFVRTLTVPW